MLAGLANPATGLPFVHDNRVIGLLARGSSIPGIGAIVSSIVPSRKVPGGDLPWQ